MVVQCQLTSFLVESPPERPLHSCVFTMGGGNAIVVKDQAQWDEHVKAGKKTVGTLASCRSSSCS